MSIKTNDSIAEAIEMLQGLGTNGNGNISLEKEETQDMTSVSSILKNVANLVSELDKVIIQASDKKPRRWLRRLLGKILIAIGEYLMEEEPE